MAAFVCIWLNTVNRLNGLSMLGYVYYLEQNVHVEVGFIFHLIQMRSRTTTTTTTTQMFCPTSLYIPIIRRQCIIYRKTLLLLNSFLCPKYDKSWAFTLFFFHQFRDLGIRSFNLQTILSIQDKIPTWQNSYRPISTRQIHTLTVLLFVFRSGVDSRLSWRNRDSHGPFIVCQKAK